MVGIKKTALEKFMGPIAEGRLDVKVSLFVVSSKNQRLKKLNLDKLSLEERAAKLEKWGRENRFVAVIQIGDQMFAHAHAQYAKHWQDAGNLTLDGKSVTVKSLSDEESEQLSAVGQAFDDHLLKEDEGEQHLEHVEGGSGIGDFTPSRRQYFAVKGLVSDQTHSSLLIELMVKRNMSQIITRCMEQYSEAKREERKQQEADDKHFDIIRSEIKKDIQKSEIKQEEIQRQDKAHRIVGEDIQRIHHTRGVDDL